MSSASSTATTPEQPITVREGKTKILTPLVNNAEQLLVTFKDRATAFNALKSEEVVGKGALNATISAKLFQFLEQQGIETCFVAQGNQPNQLIYETLTMVPVEIVVRNIALGSLVKRIPLFEAGERLTSPIVEFFYKSDELNDPALPDDALAALGVLPAGVSVAQLKHLALAVNDAFIALFTACNIDCADFKLEIGLTADGTIKIADELSPDNFRLRDSSTGEVLDKDVFRLALGSISQAYSIVESRLSQVLTAQTFSLQAPVTSRANAYFAVVQVQYKPNVLHPESRAITEALQLQGFNTVEKVKAGKRFEVTLQADNRLHAQALIESMCETLLANLVIETYCLESLVVLQPATADS
jgi:phosphoribosylaminoimidazole-succinocarboxamide synthase